MRRFFCCLLLALLAMPALAAFDVGELMGELARHRGGRAKFVEKKTISLLDKPLVSTGEMSYSAPGRLEKRTLTPENVGEKQFLRVELQTFFRLPRSNGLLFPIRCYLCALQDITAVPKWGRRLHRVLRDLPDDLATYKGFLVNKPMSKILSLKSFRE